MAIMRVAEASAMYLRIHTASATITANIDMAMMISNIVGFMSLISSFSPTGRGSEGVNTRTGTKSAHGRKRPDDWQVGVLYACQYGI